MSLALFAAWLDFLKRACSRVGCTSELWKRVDKVYYKEENLEEITFFVAKKPLGQSCRNGYWMAGVGRSALSCVVVVVEGYLVVPHPPQGKINFPSPLRVNCSGCDLKWKPNLQRLRTFNVASKSKLTREI